MARASVSKPYSTFAGGFVTEVTGLKYPEGTVRDMDNCDIELRGAVRRRLGLDQERAGFFVGQYDTSSDLLPVDPDLMARSVHVWDNVDNDPSLRFVVLQVGNSLYIRKRTNIPVSSGDVLENGTAPIIQAGLPLTNYQNSATKKLSSASGFGRLWMTSEGVYPFYLEYDREADVISAYNLDGDPVVDLSFSTPLLYIRDFNGIEDGLTNEERPVDLTPEHLYNLLNQGWNSTLISSYKTATGFYPSNSQQWILGKDQDENFQPSLLDKQDFGNSLAPRGRLLINPITGEKDGTIHTVAGIPSPLDFDGEYDEPSGTGWRTVAFFAGRVWFAGDRNAKRPNGVYFSKILRKPSDSNFFAQENDPTSENFSDLLDTDGGYIPIPEADGINRLVPFNTGVLVFAKNGVWYIRGSEAGFTPTAYGVDKISGTGLVGQFTVIQNDNAVFFWAENSVHALVDNGGFPTLQDIAEEKILSFFNQIPSLSKQFAQSVYDNISKKAFWLYYQDDNDNLYSTNVTRGLYNKVLILDARSGAFSKYSLQVSVADGLAFGVIGGFPAIEFTIPSDDEVVTTSTGEQITTLSGELVVIKIPSNLVPESFFNNIKLFVVDQAKNTNRICEFNSNRFRDFETMEPPFPSFDYLSYVQLHPETMDDLERYKQSTYVHSFFDKTETKAVLDEEGKLRFDRPSGCLVYGAWDWHESASGNKFSQPQQAYRFRKPKVLEGPTEDVDIPEGIVYTKLKVRGKGRALALRYESEPGKNFVLLGASIPFTGNAS